MKIELRVEQQIDLLNVVYEAIINEKYEKFELINNGTRKADITIVHCRSQKELTVGVYNEGIHAVFNGHNCSFWVRDIKANKKNGLYRVFKLVMDAIDQRHNEFADSIAFEIAELAKDMTVFDLLEGEFVKLEAATT